MKYFTAITAVITLITVPNFAADNAATRAERREARQEFEQLVRDINALESQPAAKRAGVAEAARQAAVTPARLEAPRKDQPRAGLAGLFLAQELARGTKMSPDEIFKKRVAGDSWTQLIQENNQNLATIESKLTLIHQAMLNASGTPRAATSLPATTATPATTPQTAATLDNTIQSVNALGQDADTRQAGLNAIARETGLTRQQVEQAQQQNQNLGLGDLFVAQQLALKTQKSVNDMWNQHLSPKAWTDIARENNADAAQIERQLARVENTMRGRTGPTAAERVRARDQSTLPNTTTPAPTTPAVFDETTFQQSIQSVNSLGQNANARQAGLTAVSQETTVPLAQVQQAQQQNQNLGLGDLFVAQELSAKTRKSIDELWRQHLSPKTWAEIVRENNQDPGDIQRKLARVEQALRNATK